MMIKTKSCLLVFLNLLFLGSLEAQGMDPRLLATGDLIFIQSQSPQSVAVQEMTGSPWTHVGMIFQHNNNWVVGEAARDVGAVSLGDFIGRSRGRRYIVKRLRADVLAVGTAEQSLLENTFRQEVGKPYDLWFEWGDERIYCSELIWKSYQRALGVVLSPLQVVGDMNLSGPAARALIEERYTRQGRRLNLAESIITPVALLNSALVEEVARSEE